MSTLENIEIQENLFEKFVEAFEFTGGYREVILECYTLDEVDREREGYPEAEQALGRVFNALWDFDAEGLANDMFATINEYNCHMKKMA